MVVLSRKCLLGAIGLALAATSLHASANPPMKSLFIDQGKIKVLAAASPQRIVGGSLVPSGSYPWTAALLNSSLQQGCGGSLVAPKWVVTAAHCTANWASFVRVGSVDRSSGGQVVRVIRRINHPNYGRGSDIALLELETPVTGIAPVQMASADPAAGSATRLLGWGSTVPQGNGGSQFLKQLDTSILARSSCATAVTGDLCISGTSSATACYGDSGGPALVNGALVGATSRAGGNDPNCGPTNAVYTSVAYFRSWIDSYVNGGGGGTGTVVHNVNLPSVSTGNWSSMYTVSIPAGTTSLVVNISGGTGDADLYVRAGAAPTTSSYTCRPYLSGNTETCTINNPTAGTTYYIGVRAYSAFSGVNMKVTRSPN
jgi:hypothetical protein